MSSRLDKTKPPTISKRDEIEAAHVAVGVKIRSIREMLDITQAELAERVFLERTSITNIEAGRQRILLHQVETFARALGTTPKNLMKGIWW